MSFILRWHGILEMTHNHCSGYCRCVLCIRIQRKALVKLSFVKMYNETHTFLNLIIAYVFNINVTVFFCFPSTFVFQISDCL